MWLKAIANVGRPGARDDALLKDADARGGLEVRPEPD